jgi:hypothetical protein
MHLQSDRKKYNYIKIKKFIINNLKSWNSAGVNQDKYEVHINGEKSLEFSANSKSKIFKSIIKMYSGPQIEI